MAVSFPDVLFVICKTGDIIKADTAKNPAKVVRVWKHDGRSEKEFLNTITLYEYVIEPTQTPESRWSRNKSRNRTLLIGGRRDGNVAVLHWSTMEVVFKADVSHSISVSEGLRIICDPIQT